MISKLSVLLKELEELSSLCTRCGLCQSVCPVFQQTGHESDVARGKLALIDGLMDAVLTDPARVLERLNRCLLCGACASSCPRGVNTLEIFIRTRVIIASVRGVSALKKFILRRIVAHPRLFHRLAALTVCFQKFFSKKSEGEEKEAMITPPFSGGRHMVPLSEKSFRSGLQADTVFQPLAGGERQPVKAAFFTGCVIDKIYPGVAQASVEALKHHQAEVFVPQSEACCGIPALSAGDREAFHRLVEHNLEIYGGREFDFLVTACATCAFTIRKLWPMIYRSGCREKEQRLKEMAEKTMDVTQFLVAQTPFPKGDAEIGKTDSSLSVGVTYHDPCHLKKSLGTSLEPRALIQASTGYRLVEMEFPDRCCGAGGSFNMEHYGLSSCIGKRKLDDILSTGADIVATTCPACMLQLSDLVSRSGSHIQVKHVMEIYSCH